MRYNLEHLLYTYIGVEGTPVMDEGFKKFLIGVTRAWISNHVTKERTTIVIDDKAEAEVYGNSTLAWYAEVIDLSNMIIICIEVAIDRDGAVSVNKLHDAQPKFYIDVRQKLEVHYLSHNNK
jgi:hypothetical protein